MFTEGDFMSKTGYVDTDEDWTEDFCLCSVRGRVTDVTLSPLKRIPESLLLKEPLVHSKSWTVTLTLARCSRMNVLIRSVRCLVMYSSGTEFNVLCVNISKFVEVPST